MVKCEHSSSSKVVCTQLKFGFFEYLHELPILQAELIAIQRAIEFSNHEGIQRIWIESVCLTAIQLLKGNAEGPWNSQATIIQIKKMLKDYNVMLTHTFREANKPADYLAKKGVDLKAAFFWKGQTEDRTLRRLMVADSLPFMRIKQ